MVGVSDSDYIFGNVREMTTDEKCIVKWFAIFIAIQFFIEYAIVQWYRGKLLWLIGQ